MEQPTVVKIGRYTIATVKETFINGKILTGIGIARLADKDKYDKNIAENMSIGRAVKALNMKKKGLEIHNPLLG